MKILLYICGLHFELELWSNVERVGMTKLENICKNRNELTGLWIHYEIQSNELVSHKNFLCKARFRNLSWHRGVFSKAHWNRKDYLWSFSDNKVSEFKLWVGKMKVWKDKINLLERTVFGSVTVVKVRRFFSLN